MNEKVVGYLLSQFLPSYLIFTMFLVVLPMKCSSVRSAKKMQYLQHYPPIDIPTIIRVIVSDSRRDPLPDPVPPSGSDLSDHGQISDLFAKNGQI